MSSKKIPHIAGLIAAPGLSTWISTVAALVAVEMVSMPASRKEGNVMFTVCRLSLESQRVQSARRQIALPEARHPAGIRIPSRAGLPGGCSWLQLQTVVILALRRQSVNPAYASGRCRGQFIPPCNHLRLLLEHLLTTLA